MAQQCFELVAGQVVVLYQWDKDIVQLQLAAVVAQVVVCYLLDMMALEQVPDCSQRQQQEVDRDHGGVRGDDVHGDVDEHG